MTTSTSTHNRSRRADASRPVRPGVVMDHQTARLLRALGEAALRLADGNAIDESFLTQLLSAPVPPTTGDLLTIPEACEQLRISRWTLYRLIHQRSISTVTIGRRRLVPAHEIDRFVNALRTQGEPL